MREIRSSGTVGEQGGNELLYPDSYLLFSYSYCDTIYRIDQSEINPFIFIDFDKSQQLEELSHVDKKNSPERSRIIQGNDFAGIQYIQASEKYFYANYANSSVLYKLFYSFKTKKLHHIRQISNDIDGVPFLFFPIKLSDNDMFVTIHPINIIEHFQNDVSANKLEMPNALEGINIDDNPIIAVIKLKEF